MQGSTTEADRHKAKITWGILVVASIIAIVFQLGPSIKLDGWSIKSFEWRLWDWYVEDAAISFAYARHWAEGDGLVAFQGGERIEGYSNPTWVALMALWHLVGVDGWWSSKLMAMVLSLGSLVLMYRLAEAVIDDRDSWAPQLAPLLLAISPTFAFYNAAGLENPLFTFLLAGGMWRTVVEGRDGGRPWAAVWFLLLACTRPDGIMYAALGGFVWMVLSLGHGRGLRPTLVWLTWFFAPFVVYQAIRYSYFAWTFPNTYYAKLGDRNFAPFYWGAGWKYVRGFGYDTGLGWFAPVFLSGLVGLRRGRWAWVGLGSLVYALVFLYPDAEITKGWSWWPSDMPEPPMWPTARVWLLLGTALIMMVVALRDRRSAGRILAFGCVMLGVFFAVRARGDWMNGYRWMAMIQVPLVLLLTVGIDEIASLLQRLYARSPSGGWTTPGWLGSSLLTLGLLPGFVSHADFLFSKRVIGPYSVHRRVQYTEFLSDRLWQFDVPVYNLDVDMGAHMWWTRHRMLDMAGLVDVPVAQHTWKQRKFAEHYVYEQHPPFVAHLHGGWASKTRLKTYPAWEKGWVEVPGFPVSRRTYHMGNHVRRDTMLARRFSGPAGRQVRFEGGVTLEGFDIPSPETAPGGGLYLEVGLSYRQVDDREDFRLLVFLGQGGEALHVVDYPVGYDWIPPTEWRMEEVFHGRFAFPIPDHLPPGGYDLGFVVVSAEGEPWKVARDPETGAPVDVSGQAVVGERGGDHAPWFVDGEVRFARQVTLGDPGRDLEEAVADRDQAVAEAEAGRCDQAARAWALARFHLPLDRDWWEANRPGSVVAACFARRAAGRDDLLRASWDLDAARVWDFREPTYLRVGREVSAAMDRAGNEAMARRDWSAAFEFYDGAVRARPSFSWARRRAETARDYMLGLSSPPDEAVSGREEQAAATVDRPQRAAPGRVERSREGEAVDDQDARRAKKREALRELRRRRAEERAAD